MSLEAMLGNVPQLISRYSETIELSLDWDKVIVVNNEIGLGFFCLDMGKMVVVVAPHRLRILQSGQFNRGKVPPRPLGLPDNLGMRRLRFNDSDNNKIAFVGLSNYCLTHQSYKPVDNQEGAQSIILTLGSSKQLNIVTFGRRQDPAIASGCSIRICSLNRFNNLFPYYPLSSKDKFLPKVVRLFYFTK